MKYIIDKNVYSSKASIHKYFKEVKSFYAAKDVLTREHQIEVWNLLQYHPNKDEKIGCGIKHFKVDYKDHGTTCFYVVRKDDTHASFSYPTCIDNIPVPKKQKA